MSESKIQDKAAELAGKAFDKAVESGQPLSTALANRFASPFFFSFIVSWCLINWERLAVLFFGKGEVEERIIKVKGISSVFFVDHALTYYLPLISTMIIVFFSPYLNNLIDNFHKKAFREKYVHSAGLEAEKYNAQGAAINAKIEYETAEKTKILEIEANQARLVSEKEISSLNLDQAHQSLADLRERIKLETENLADASKQYKNRKEQAHNYAKNVEELNSLIVESQKESNSLDVKIKDKKMIFNNLTNDIHRLEMLKKELDSTSKMSYVGSEAPYVFGSLNKTSPVATGLIINNRDWEKQNENSELGLKLSTRKKTGEV
ncbi:hypothetical protein ACVWYV_003420 [Pantoea eucalypti]|jgi:hypothetical protein